MTSPTFIQWYPERITAEAFDDLKTVIPEVAEQYRHQKVEDFSRDLANAAKYVRQHDAFHKITDLFAPVWITEDEANENTEKKED